MNILDGDYVTTTTLRTSGYGTHSQAEAGIARMLKELRLKMPNAGVTLLSREIRYIDAIGGATQATWRTGRTNDHTIYLQIDTHPTDDDVFIGSCRTPEFADELVNAANRDALARIYEWLVSLDLEDVAEAVHAAWLRQKVEAGLTSHLSHTDEELMKPYAELSEEAKDLDRVTVRAVCDALIRKAQNG